MKLFRQGVLIAILVSGLLVAWLPSAQASIDSAAMAGSCSGVTVVVDYTREDIESDESLEVYVFLAGDTLLGFASADAPFGVASGQMTFTITFDEQPEGTHIFVDVVHWSDDLEYEDIVSFEYDCTNMAVPGCDVLLLLPAQAVMGHFMANSEIYWMPGQTISPMEYVEAGKTYYVVGQDATETYYKVLIACEWVWVRKDTVGPNYDEVWNGTPLPTTIVE